MSIKDFIESKKSQYLERRMYVKIREQDLETLKQMSDEQGIPMAELIGIMVEWAINQYNQVNAPDQKSS